MRGGAKCGIAFPELRLVPCIQMHLSIPELVAIRLYSVRCRILVDCVLSTRGEEEKGGGVDDEINACVAKCAMRKPYLPPTLEDTGFISEPKTLHDFHQLRVRVIKHYRSAVTRMFVHICRQPAT